MSKLLGSLGPVVGFAALVWTVCGQSSALAVPVTDFIVVQPIDVCSGANSAGAPTGCAVVNSSNQSFATKGASTPIGFIDPASGQDITRDLLNQIGVDVTYQPLTAYVNSAAQTQVVTGCNSNGGDCTSTTFQTLTDQFNISQGVSPINPSPPLSNNPTTINMFFVQNLKPPANQPGVLYGLSWVNGNGVAIGQSTFAPPLGQPQRPDTIAHELSHDLGLDHTTFGAGGSTNLATAGSARTEPGAKLVANSAGQPQAQWVTQVPPGNTTASALGQLNAAQQAAVLTSGFINPIPLVTSSVSTDPLFVINFPSDDTSGETLTKWIFDLPSGFYFGSDNFSETDRVGSFSYTETLNHPGELEIDFSGFVTGDKLAFFDDICHIDGGCSFGAEATDGSTISYLFSDGYETTSDVVFNSDTGTATSDSQDPDPTIAPEIVGTFIPASSTPCTLLNGATACPTTLELADGSPVDEGGQPVPEPASLPILVSALGIAFIARRRLARAA